MMPKTPATDDLCDELCIHPESVRAARDALISPGAAQVAAAAFATLGDPTRLRLLHALTVRELCVCDLALVLGIKQPAVSQHLRVLRSLGMVQVRREGRMAFYSLADERIAALLRDGIAVTISPVATPQIEGAA